jgi:hypothetical protein
MARPDFPRTILEFQRRFADEAACRTYLFAFRWPDGFHCPGCGSERATALPKRLLWQGTVCRHQVSVTAGKLGRHRTATATKKGANQRHSGTLSEYESPFSERAEAICLNCPGFSVLINSCPEGARSSSPSSQSRVERTPPMVCSWLWQQHPERDLGAPHRW